MTDIEIVDAEKILKNTVYLPEIDPISLNF